MIYYFLALLATAAVLLASDIRSSTNRWGAFFLLFAAIGGLSGAAREAGLEGAARAIEFLNLTVTPCGVLAFAISYADVGKRGQQRPRLPQWLLFLPVPIMLAAGFGQAEFRIHNLLLLLWSGPYYLLACYLLLRSLWRERDERRRRARLIATVLIVPTLLAVLGFIYVARVVSPAFAFFDYISFFIAYSLAAGVLLAFVYGVLGVKLRMERDPLESAMKAASSGTQLLNHTIKNEIGKIAISADNLRHTLPEGVREEASAHLGMIDRASGHMLAMVGRIHSQTKDIVLQERPVRLDELAAMVMREHQERLPSDGVAMEIQLRCQPTVICDPVHIREAFGNLLSNAIEAVPPGSGHIVVRVDTVKRSVRLSVDDNGPGIPHAQADRLFEPFYSTKNGSEHFGLGLSYVYQVMRECGGTVAMVNREGGGTTASLVFPRRKVMRVDMKEENDDGGTH
ncbi:HAMP domain-containing sensor histidine kinase [Paenibacillus sp. PL2-23]|uniref:sensor histidine kinase n=1 Tax=Paenibacillus sp. PL2-23 TaxID=2100729 RepID=UPI0030F4C671